ISRSWLFSWLLWTFACWWSVGFCGKVVVWPTDASHWINMKVLLEELILRGHEVTVLVPSINLLIDYQDASSPFTFEVLKVNITQETLDALMEDFLNLWINDLPNLFPWEVMWRMKEAIYSFSNLSKQSCDALVSDPQLIAKLHQAKFDILIADPLAVCGELAADLLAIPFVYSFRFSEGNVVERLCGGLPSPPSYVPASTTGLTDHMSFVERLQNFFFYFAMDLFFLKFWRDEWDGYYSNVLGRPTTLCETMGKAEIWLIRTYWDFEFPRPFLPNFEFVGGLHCQPAKPLPKEIEEFVQSSGEHGIVVFSLGSMVYNLTDERSNVIAKALSQLPQNVLWRYKGKKPETLGSNTRIYDWIPQNDLLGHPLTKAFITHGGTNGIYEAIYHGIPIVGIPMFADQHDNVAHMRAKGAAVELDFSTLTTQDLVDAVNTVINNSTYKESALKLSKIHHDQPIKPLDRAVFWIEFVMRHKGAKHLRPAAHHLTWYQYHCLDVLAFLFTCAAIAGFILVKCCMFCCRKCSRVTKKKKE
uniref:UDP-glucuronosyltransferase n=1 Tax=Phasianus colchicus TaxID=9054 RepID=A0A669Q3N0_PHACC